MNPSGASSSRTSFIPRWSRNAPIERKTSSKSWRGAALVDPHAVGSPRVEDPSIGSGASVASAPAERQDDGRARRASAAPRGDRRCQRQREPPRPARPGDARVVDDQGRVGADRRAIGQDGDPREQPRRQRRTRDAGVGRLGDGSLHGLAGDVVGQRVGRGDRHADEDPATEPEPELRRRRARPRRRRPATDAGRRDPRRAGVEPGQLRLTDRDDRDAARLEVLERGRDVEDRLRPGAHDGHRRPPELLEVRRDVEGRRGRAPSRPPSRARARRGGRRRSRPSRRPRIPAAWAAIIVADTVVAAHPPPASAAARLGRAALRTRPGRCRGEREQGRLVEADQQPPAVDRDRRRDRAGRPDRRLGRGRDLDVLRVRQAVADQRRFERDDRPALGQGGRDVGAGVESVGAHRWR